MRYRSLIIPLVTFGLFASMVEAAEHYNNFDNGSSSDWTTTGGSWTVSGGKYNLGATSYGGKSRISSTYAGLVYDADITINAGYYDAGIFFRANNIGSGPDNFSGYYAYLDENSDKVGLARNPGFNVIGLASLPILKGVPYRLSVIAVDNRIRVYVDDKLYIDLDDATYTSGMVGLTSYVASVSYDNVIVSSETQGSMRESFANGSGKWLPYDNAGYFSVVNKAYKIAASSYGAKAMFSNSEAVDNIIHCDITLNGLYASDAGVLRYMSGDMRPVCSTI